MSIQQDSSQTGVDLSVGEREAAILTDGLLERTNAEIAQSQEHNQVPDGALPWINAHGAVHAEVPGVGRVQISIGARNGQGPDLFELLLTPAGGGREQRLTSERHAKISQLYWKARTLANEPQRILQLQVLQRRAQPSLPGL